MGLKRSSSVASSFPGATVLGRRTAAAAVFSACFGYAYVRYIIAKGDPLTMVPLYITNKAISVFAVAMLGAAIARPRAEWCQWARSTGLIAAVIHGLASLALLSPAYFPKLYLQTQPFPRFDWTGELTLILGVLMLVAFGALKFMRTTTEQESQKATLISHGALILVVGHCAALGLSGWFNPTTWPASMMPLTLIGALLASVAVVLGSMRRGG